MIVTIIGTGLIGGSMALTLKEKGFATKVIGVDASEQHLAQALALGIIEEAHALQDAVVLSDLIIIATPINAAENLLPQVLDIATSQVVMDVGSTKNNICKIVEAHPKRGRFVATHPMWGTEYSGPEAAVKNAFADKATVICSKEASDPDAAALVEQVYHTLGMHLLFMDADAHDVHVAYISHISHITSFALANTVLEKEREEDAIFELASGGFESTVRLAKSNPSMWVPILMQNKENVLDVLNEHISQLRKFKASLEKEDPDYLLELIEKANGIKRILK
jgi:prephenate dehydrogenase